jgi:hypothetical protein
VIASALLVGTTLLVVFGPAGSVDTWRYAALGVAISLSTVGCWWALCHSATRATFYGLFLVVALELALVATTTDHLR